MQIITLASSNNPDNRSNPGMIDINKCGLEGIGD